MRKIKNRALTAFEIFAIAREIGRILTNSFVKKIYQKGNRLYIVLRKGQDFTLLIGPDRLYITNYREKFPAKPWDFVMALRKKLEGAKLEKIEQHNFERIVELTFAKKDVKFFLIAELFSQGNIILLNSQRAIKCVLNKQEWKARSIRRGAQYKYPPETANLKKLSLAGFSEIFANSKADIVRTLAKDLGIGGLYSEEICIRANVNKSAPASSAAKQVLEKIYCAIKELSKEIEENPKAVQYLRENEIKDISPVKLNFYPQLETRELKSFSEACDEFFIKIRIAEIESKKDAIKEKYGRILEKQEHELQEFEQGIQKWKSEADTLSIKQEFREASKLYEKVKKGRKKIQGLKKAIEMTKRKISGIKIDEKQPVKKEKKEKKAWFEKFRHFRASDGFLVVCGKDASTNELLIKTHTSKGDVVFHADIAGAPFCAIKTEGKKASENALKEVAQISASYSKAWQRGLGEIDVYWVMPEQLSKRAPPGEYVPTGAFMVYGKKNYFYKTELEIAIGIDKNLEILAGAADSIKEKAIAYAIIIPGNEKSKELADKIKRAWMKKVSKEMGENIKKIPNDAIQRYIPAGKGRLKK